MIKIEIDRDYAIIANQRVERPENVVPGDWLDFFDAAVSPVDYQEAFEEGAESVHDEVADEISQLEGENADLKEEIRSLENEVENLELEIERLGGEVE